MTTIGSFTRILPFWCPAITSRTLEQRLKHSYDHISCWLRSVKEARLVVLAQDAQLHEFSEPFFPCGTSASSSCNSSYFPTSTSSMSTSTNLKTATTNSSSLTSITTNSTASLSRTTSSNASGGSPISSQTLQSLSTGLSMIRYDRN